MNRYFASNLVIGTVIAATAAALAIVLSSNAHADDIAVDNTPFVSGMTRAEVGAQLKVPHPAGNPWSSLYNMFQVKTATSSEQVRTEYKRTRNEVSALTGEDSGSAYFAKRAVPFASADGALMGAPGR